MRVPPADCCWCVTTATWLRRNGQAVREGWRCVYCGRGLAVCLLRERGRARGAGASEGAQGGKLRQERGVGVGGEGEGLERGRGGEAEGGYSIGEGRGA